MDKVINLGYSDFINNRWKWDYIVIINFLIKDGFLVLYISLRNLEIIMDESKKSLHYVYQDSSFSNS